MKPETQKLIDELLCSVPIEINYKHDIFLRETKQYAKYEKKLVKTQQSLIDAKKEITFTDIKLDIIRNQGEKKLKELEVKYVNLCTSRARGADKNLDDFFKDDIADKLTEFMLDVNAAKKKNLTGYLDKVKQNMKLVYQDGIQPPYQFNSLDVLLDTVAKASVCYCMGSTDYSALCNIDKTSKSKTTPLFIRQVCAIICYTLLDFGNYVSIKKQGKQIEATTGVTTQIMNDLHNRCVSLGHPYFTSETKVFQYDKWSISPEEMLRRRSYIPPKAPISYAGMKQGWLGYMIAELQKQVPYKKFLDAFGGSGMSNVQFKHREDAEYYVNDFHFANVAYYRVLKAPNEEYNQFLDCLMIIQNCVKIAVEKDTSGNWTRQQFNEYIKRLYNIYTSVSDVCVNTKSLYYVDYNGVCSEFLSIISSLDNTYTECSMKPYIIIAAVFTAFANMTINGGMDFYIINSTASFLNKSRTVFEKLFDNLREEYKTTEIVNCYGANAIDLLKDSRYNNDTTLAYLDSPYIGTMEYDASKNSSDTKYPKGTIIPAEDTGNDFISNDFDMMGLMDRCENYKGKFIFSCRLNMPSPEPQGIVTGTFKSCGYTQNQVRQHYNNYIWFFERWKNMKNIKDCYAFCMVDTDWYLLQQKSLLYYQNKNIPQHYRPVNEEFKSKFIEADWGMVLSSDTKEKVYNYLRAVILCGENFEIMITNYNCEAPVFGNMYEHEMNLYSKGAEPISKKNKKEEDEVKEIKNTEILIPENGMFVKIPMNLIAELVLTEFKDIKRSFEIK